MLPDIEDGELRDGLGVQAAKVLLLFARAYGRYCHVVHYDDYVGVVDDCTVV